MTVRWLLAVVAALAVGFVGVVLSRKWVRRGDLTAKVVGYRYDAGELSIRLDLRAPAVEDVDVLVPRPPDGSWRLGGMSLGLTPTAPEGGRSPVHSPREGDRARDRQGVERLPAHVSVRLEIRDPVPTEGDGNTLLVLLAELENGTWGLICISVNRRGVMEGARDAVKLVRCCATPGIDELRAAWAYDVRHYIAVGRFEHESDVARAEQLVRDLRSAPAPMPPRLLAASWLTDESSGVHRLVLQLYDESRRVTGIRVREYVSGGDLEVQEDYEVYPRGRINEGMFSGPMFRVQLRTADERKDPEAWARYAATAERPSVQYLPVIWLSPPSESRRVEISLVDADGNETEPVPLLRIVGTR